MIYESLVLSELTDYINRGITPKYTTDGNCLVINQKCIRNNSIDLTLARKNDANTRKVNSDKMIQLYDILINSTGVGTLGRLAQIKKINGTVTCDSHVTIVRPNVSKINPLYLGYYLLNNQHQIELMAQGSTGQTELSRHILGAIEVKFPNLNKQKLISQTLLSLDDKIEINNKINSNLEELAQTFYKRWFVDFEFPNEEGKPYKSSGGEMVESELGLIPKGWEVKSLRDIMDFQGGFSFKGNRDNLDLQYKIITIKNVQDGYMDLSVVSSIDQIPEKMKESQVLQVGDVLVSLTGNVGRTCIVNQKHCLLNQRVEKISSIVSNLQGFTYFLIRSSQMNSVMQSLSKGSAQQNLSPVELSNQKIAITNDLAAKFDVFNSLFQSILNNQIQNMSLTKTRDLLLPKLMSGEIEV